MSLKEGEWMRRNGNTHGIDIIGMNRDTPIPNQPDKFWASQENKRNLQLLVQAIVSDLIATNATVIASSFVCDDEVLPAKATGGECIPDLQNWIEEADSRLVVHVAWAVRVKGCQRIVVVSNDTDTFVLLMRYFPYLQQHGLVELWQQYGTGERRRMLPLHQAVAQLGAQLSKTLIKAHILTGDDCLSKIGTKHAAIACDPLQFLSNVGENDILSIEDMAQTEAYLVKVWAGARSNTTARTFDQLRLETYTRTSTGLDSLPPTSSVIEGHIRRGHFLIRKACTLLANSGQPYRLDPENHGWENRCGTLIPSKCFNSLPASFVTLCKCLGRCDTRRCGCRHAGVQCVIFCHGKTVNTICRNVPQKD